MFFYWWVLNKGRLGPCDFGLSILVKLYARVYAMIICYYGMRIGLVYRNRVLICELVKGKFFN